MKIGERLSSMRKTKGLSQRALAYRAGVSNTTIARIESDVVEPDTSTIEKLAFALDVSTHYLTGWANDRTDYNNPQFVASLEVPLGFTGTQTEYAEYLFEKDLHADLEIEARERATDDSENGDDIRFIARKMKNANPKQKEMLMRMIKAAFADDDE